MQTLYKIARFNIFFLFLLCLAMSGCGGAVGRFIGYSLEITPVQPSQDEIGSFHIAALSVARWVDYVKELQPTFEMTPEVALKEVVPTTSIYEQKIMDYIGAEVKVALSPITMDAAKIASNYDTSSASAASTSNNKASDMTAPQGAIAIDQMTKYLAATALFQEVKLLNMYIKNAVANEDEYTPFVVRLQVTLMPAKHDLPYDVYANLSFFDREQIATYVIRELEGTETDCKETKVENGKVIEKKIELGPTEKCKTRYDEDYKNNGNYKTPIVIPLLVTDNIENMLASRTEDKLRQYALGLSGLIGSVGAGASIKQNLENFASKRGNNLNSLLTVAKLSDNTIRVRLGAMNQTGPNTNGYAMIPQTHNITVLLLMPNATSSVENCNEAATSAAEQCKEVKTLATDQCNGALFSAAEACKNKQGEKVFITALTTMIDTNTGKSVQGRDFENSHGVEQLLKLAGMKKLQDKKTGDDTKTDDPDRYDKAKALHIFASENDWPNFLRLCEIYKEGKDCETLWTEMIALRVGSTYAYTSFTLPKIKPSTHVFFKPQVALLRDDTEEKTVVSLIGGKNLNKEYLSATLYIKNEKNEKPDADSHNNITTNESNKCEGVDKHYPLIANSIELIDSGRTADFAFPSLKAWGLSMAKDNARLEITNANGSSPEIVCLDKVVYLPKPEPNYPGFTATVTATSISADNGKKGSIDVIFKMAGTKPATKIFFEVRGADIEAATAKTNVISGYDKGNYVGRYIDADGMVTLKLKNLGAISPLVISSRNQDNVAAPDIVIPIEMSPAL